MKTFDSIIIGAGPAGIAAAIELARLGLSFAFYEKDEIGGQIIAANLIENYPGFPNGIIGHDFVDLLKKQISALGIRIAHSRINQITKNKDGFLATTDNDKISARTIIIANGLIPKRLDIPGENALFNKKIFAYIDPQKVEHENKEVLVIGSGDAAFDQALNFARKAKSVTVAMKHDSPKCAPNILDRVSKSKIKILSNHVVISFESMPVVPVKTGIQCIFKKTGSPIKAFGDDNLSIMVDIVVECIGKEPRKTILTQELTKPDIQGVYLAGDCKHSNCRYIAVAIGDGIKAASEAANYLYGNTI